MLSHHDLTPSKNFSSRDAPSGRDRGEELVAMSLFKLRRAIVTAVEFKQVSTFVVVVKSSESAVYGPLSHVTVDGHIADGLVDGRIFGVDEVFTSSVIVLVCVFFSWL